MKRFLILTQSLALAYVREPMVVFWNLVFPLFLLVIYRFVFGEMNVGGNDFMQWVVPGVVVLNVLSFGILGSASFMLQMRTAGVLRRLQATPTPTAILFGAFMAVNVLMCLAQTAAVIVFAAVVFGWTTSLHGLLLSLPMILLSVVVAVALGQCISSLSPRFSIALAVGQLIYFVQMFIAGLVIPMEMMPGWLQEVARLLPAYAIGDLVRSPLLDGGLSAEAMRNAALAVAYGLMAGFIATRFFRWESRA
ncbi:MAG: ABC transporter permease [Candidatus Brachytrichaceae bacterium NZ_4S206]|jgi:ABC-2 type transport system permease protein